MTGDSRAERRAERPGAPDEDRARVGAGPDEARRLAELVDLEADAETAELLRLLAATRC